jgi:hypothetical protein
LRRVFYSVPSRLTGHRLNVRLYDDRLGSNAFSARRSWTGRVVTNRAELIGGVQQPRIVGLGGKSSTGRR